MILSLDPSSTAIGTALHDGDRFVDISVIRPATKKEPEPCRRAWQMGAEVQAILDEHAGAIGLVLIERPPPTQGKRRSNPSAQHQAFGVLMGVLLGSKVPVEIVHPATWTRNSRKEARAADVRARHRLPAGSDKGNDACDAIGMCEWWLEQGRHRAAAPAAEAGER